MFQEAPPSRYVGRAPRGEEGGSLGMSAARSAAKRGEKPLRVDPSTPLGHMSGATEGPQTPLLVSLSGSAGSHHWRIPGDKTQRNSLALG